MTERLHFVQDALSDRFTMAEVCARYGVSRKTGYKWIARYAEASVDTSNPATDRHRKTGHQTGALRLG